MGETTVLIALIHFDRTVENGQLLLEQLQIGVDKTQLERNRFAQFLVAGGPGQTKKKERYTLTVRFIWHIQQTNTNGTRRQIIIKRKKNGLFLFFWRKRWADMKRIQEEEKGNHAVEFLFNGIKRFLWYHWKLIQDTHISELVLCVLSGKWWW